MSPRDDWTRVQAAVDPGDEIVLAPGAYPGGWRITRGGTATAPLVVRSLDSADPARFTPSSHGPLIDVRAANVTLRDLRFGPTPAGMHAVVVSGVDSVTVETCQFDGIGGLAVAQTMTGSGLVLRGNRIQRSRSTAIYLGCHTGGCSVTGVFIEDNEIDGVTASWRGIGYGVQIKLESSATIRSNLIRDTKGPAVMVYGSRRLDLLSVIERNTVSGSRRSSGIVVGGGPARVHGNVTAGHAEAGIALEDYGRRGLVRAVEVTANVVHGNRRGGILISGRAVDVMIAGNVVHARPGTPALPSVRPGIDLGTNVDCSGGPCHG